MSNEKANEPAFPIVEDNVVEGQMVSQMHYPGLTKREYFAGLILQGLASQQAPADRILNESNQSLKKQLVSASIQLTDELLKQLNQ